MKRDNIDLIASDPEKGAHPVRADAVLGVSVGCAGKLVNFRPDKEMLGSTAHGGGKLAPFRGILLGRPREAGMFVEAGLVTDRPVAYVVAFLDVGVVHEFSGLLGRAVGEAYVDIGLGAHAPGEVDNLVNLIGLQIVVVAPGAARVAQDGDAGLLGERQSLRAQRDPGPVVGAIEQRVNCATNLRQAPTVRDTEAAVGRPRVRSRATRREKQPAGKRTAAGVVHMGLYPLQQTSRPLLGRLEGKTRAEFMSGRYVYFSTPVTTTPWMKTRWARKKSSTGNAMAMSAAA